MEDAMNSTELSTSWEAKQFLSQSKKKPVVYGIRKFNTNVTNAGPCTEPYESSHSIPFFNIHFNIIVPFTPTRFPKWPIFFVFTHQNSVPVCLFSLIHITFPARLNVHIDLTSSRVRATIVTVEKQLCYTFWVCVCSHSYPACNAHASYCHLQPVWLYHIFSHNFTNGTVFGKYILLSPYNRPRRPRGWVEV